MPPDRGVGRRGAFEGPNNEREIDFLPRAGELSRERWCAVSFRDDETAARLLVETMNNAGTLFSPISERLRQ
jgi:hypothetical protein